MVPLDDIHIICGGEATPLQTIIIPSGYKQRQADECETLADHNKTTTVTV